MFQCPPELRTTTGHIEGDMTLYLLLLVLTTQAPSGSAGELHIEIFSEQNSIAFLRVKV